ncbi:hypothetical protein H5410_013863 [Solanum commersonii]|uniref:Uncharacterized protein n=1 Tax=Solanum commersonii TaxID=4109 RepID=A0A9J5ZPQ6_SOLCO|nr:hypothetical protein H5410_013863 [Solanum commersonii]
MAKSSPHRPHIFLNDFSIPALGHGDAGGGPENAHISFRVTARNSNQGIGIYYDASQVTPKNSTLFASMLSGSSLTLTESQWKQMMHDRSRGQ